MDVSSATAAAPATSQASQSQATLGQDFDQFLNLLTTQLQNQDPLDPMDSNEFTNQLVAFSGVEQQIRTNSLLESQMALDALNITSLGVGFIGMDVEHAGEFLEFNGSDPLTLSYIMPEQSVETTVTIFDANGNSVYSVGGETSEGQQSFTWDGNNSEGFTSPAGTYRVQISAMSTDDVPLNIGTSVPGRVTGIESANDGNVLLLVGDQKVPITDVKIVREASNATAPILNN